MSPPFVPRQRSNQPLVVNVTVVDELGQIVSGSGVRCKLVVLHIVSDPSVIAGHHQRTCSEVGMRFSRIHTCCVTCAGGNGATAIAVVATNINQSLTLYGQTKQVTQVSTCCPSGSPHTVLILRELYTT